MSQIERFRIFRALQSSITPSLMQRYVLRHFFRVLFLCLLASVSLFIVFNLFERLSLFLREGATFAQVASYMFYQVPLIIHLMMPVAILVAVILSVGRLSQQSEVTAMRACGVSLFTLAKPLLAAGLFVSLLMFISGETILPLSTQRLEDIYHLDIRRKAEKGAYSRANFWYRSQDRFYNIGVYDSRSSALRGVSVIELDSNFRLKRRTDAREATWGGHTGIGWTMHEVIEIAVDRKGYFDTAAFAQLPLVINEQPTDFYNTERRAESMSYRALSKYIDKLRSEGVPVTSYLVDLASKISFPLVNMIVVIIAFPFALIPARSGSLTLSFVAAVSIGFGYYVVHAFSVSLGNGELLPVWPAAWTANIILGSIGAYLMTVAEDR